MVMQTSPPPEDGSLLSGPSETQPLLGACPQSQIRDNKKPKSAWAVTSILSVLLVGVLVANADMTLLLAIYPQISSDFNAMAYGSWLLAAYMLATCATQPLYGKLSSIFGRKPMLILSYALYAAGSAICGLGQTMWQVILGRLVAGTGGAGMVCLVSIIITDIVPLRQVAEYRSYVNIVQTIGRSVGGPIGGLIADKLGWRAAFGALCPMTIVGIVLIVFKLDSILDKEDEKCSSPRSAGGGEENDGSSPPSSNPKAHKDDIRSTWASVKRVDLLGSLLLAATITLALTTFTIGGTEVSWTHPLIPGIGCTSLALGLGFYVWETRYAADPVFPPSILTHRAVWTAYLLLLLQNMAQSAATLSVPLFFQVTQGASTARAGAYLLPSVVGNTLGGLGTGFYIRRTGRYKLAGVLAGAMGLLGYGLMIARWSADPESFVPAWDDLELVFAGLATGTAHSAAFIVLTAGISAGQGAAATRRKHSGDEEESVGEHGDEDDGINNNEGINNDEVIMEKRNDDSLMAIGSAGIYLSGNIGGVIGLSVSSALLQGILVRDLSAVLDPEVVRRAVSDIGFVQHLPLGSKLRDVVVSAYVSGFRATFWEAAVCSALSIVMGLLVREHRFES